MDTMVSPAKVARVMGLKRKVGSLIDLDEAVQAGLPKAALKACLAQVYERGPDLNALLYRVVPEATYKRRGDALKPDESERTERLARVIATAQYVWDDDQEARRFLTAPHTELAGQAPIEVALSELGARRVELLLWKLFHGIPA